MESLRWLQQHPNMVLLYIVRTAPSLRAWCLVRDMLGWLAAGVSDSTGMAFPQERRTSRTL
ncbi:hypothetical protein H0178_54530 [Cytobacillus firmus]|nr:hypothetical protein [Cytobacillus firmus]